MTEAAYDAFIDAFVASGVLTPSGADELTDQISAAAAKAAPTDELMNNQLDRLLKPGVVVVLTGLVDANSAHLNGRIATVVYSAKTRCEPGHANLMLSEEDSLGYSLRRIAHANLRPARRATWSCAKWPEYSLFAAIEAGDAVALQRLLALGAPVDTQRRSETPLLRALLHRHEACVDALLQAGASVAHATDDGCTPLIMLAEPVPDELTDAPGARLVHRLLARGASATLEMRDCNGCTALGASALRGNAEVAEALINGGADANAADADGVSPLMLAFCGDASKSTQTKLVHMLLAAGARVDAADHEFHDVLFFCRFSGRVDLLRTLQEHEDDDDDDYGPDGMRVHKRRRRGSTRRPRSG